MIGAASIVALLVGCGSTVEPFDRADASGVSGVDVGSYDVQAVARLFNAGQARTFEDGQGAAVIFLRNATACEVVEAVFVDQLRLQSTCTASGGSLSAFTSGDPQTAYETAVFVLRSAGYTVTRREDVVDVSGGGSGSAAAAVGGLPPQPNDDGRGSQPIVATDIAFIGGVPRGEVVFRYTSADFESVQAFAAVSSAPVVAVQTPQGVALIGSPGDVEGVEAAVLRRPGVLVIPLAGRSYEALASVLASIDGIDVQHDAARNELLAVGDPSAIATATSITRAIVGRASPLIADVAFLSYGHEELQSFGIEPGIAVNLGQLGLQFGTSTGSPFSLVIDQLSRGQASHLDVRPSVSVLPGVPVGFSSGSSVPVVGSIDEDDRQSVDFVDVGTDLQIECSIAGAPGSGVYRCDVVLSVSEVVGTGIVDNPVIASRRVATSVQLQRGQVVFLAAFSQDGESRGRSTTLLFPSRAANSTSGSLSVAFGLR